MDIDALKRQLMDVGDNISEGMLNGIERMPKMITMIGWKRLTNLEYCLSEIIKNKIKGDVIETGVWKGGACIFMRKTLNDYNSDKIVYVADSFEGLPKPDDKYIHDKGDTHYAVPMLAVSLDDVKQNFIDYDCLENTVFLKGWFKDTLPTLKNKFSLIRLDGDMFESTIDALDNLYPKLSIGGFCIIDDYFAVAGCNKAVEFYREKFNIKDKIIVIDGCGVYWKKTK